MVEVARSSKHCKARHALCKARHASFTRLSHKIKEVCRKEHAEAQRHARRSLSQVVFSPGPPNKERQEGGAGGVALPLHSQTTLPFVSNGLSPGFQSRFNFNFNSDLFKSEDVIESPGRPGSEAKEVLQCYPRSGGQIDTRLLFLASA